MLMCLVSVRTVSPVTVLFSAFQASKFRAPFLHRHLNGSSFANAKEPVDLTTTSKKELVEMYDHTINSYYCNIRVLGTGSSEIIPSFLVKCVKQTYLFNCGGGFVRLKGVLRKNPVLFFTRASWENMEGCLSLSSHFNNNVKYVGPSKCSLFLDVSSKFFPIEGWKSAVHSSRYCDDGISVSVIDLKGTGDEQRSHTVVAYSCKLSDDPGKLDAEKAVELGVPRGPAFKLLVEGRSVSTKSGGVVHPAQVMGETTKGPSFLVIDCPNRSFLESVCSNQKLQPQWFREKGESLKLMVHITPLHILEEELYCKWMASFGDGVDHLFLHSSVCPGEVSLRRALTFSMPFHLMNPQVYHFPHIPSEDKIRLKDMKVSKYVSQNSLLIGRVDLNYGLKAKSNVAVDRSLLLTPLDNKIESDYNSILMNKHLYSDILEYHRSLSECFPWDKRDIVHHLSSNEDCAGSLDDPDDCMVTILGTSSAESNDFRNVSGILVQSTQDGNLLLDCGVGTVGQLYRCFGKDRTHDILQNIHTIFISHLHADHCFGIFSMLLALHESRNVKDPPITLIAPRDLFRALGRWNKHHSLGKLEFCGICSTYLTSKSYPKKRLNFKTVPVDHIKNSHALILSRGDDWSVVYSGDTAPCADLAREGKGATLLIHEGTFTNEYANRAEKTRHSTYSDVVDISKKMNAKFTIMTHFSRTGPLHSLWKTHRAAGVIPGVDLMSVRLSDLHKQKLSSPESTEVFNSIATWSRLQWDV